MLVKVLKTFFNASSEQALMSEVTMGMQDCTLESGDEPFPTKSFTLRLAQQMYPNIRTFPTVDGDCALDVTEDFLVSIAREIYASRPVQMTPVEVSDDDDSKGKGEEDESVNTKKRERQTKARSSSELKDELLTALSKGESINALKVRVTNFLLLRTGITTTVTKGTRRTWLNKVITMVRRVCETEQTGKDMIPEKEKEEEEEDEEGNGKKGDEEDEDEVESDESKKKKAKADIQEFLEMVFSQCVRPEVEEESGMQSDNEEEEDEDGDGDESEGHLQKVRRIKNQLYGAVTNVWQSTLLDGYYIETSKRLYGHSLGKIANALNYKTDKASSDDAITVPREIYKFIVNTGMFMLLHFQASRGKVTAGQIYRKRKAIQKYFQENPDELLKWQEGISAPTKKIVKVNKKKHPWIDYKWLLQQ